MAIDMSTVKTIINNGNNKEIVKIEDSLGRVLWQKAAGAKDVFVYYDRLYKIDPTTLTFSVATLNGTMALSYLDSLWTDGMGVYYSAGAKAYNSAQKEMTVSNGEVTATPNASHWSGITKLYGQYTFTPDGTNIYHYDGSSFYKLNPATGVWTVHTFNNTVSGMRGTSIFMFGGNAYSIIDSNHIYRLNTSTNNWVVVKNVSGTSDTMTGPYFWTPDDTHLFYTNSTFNYNYRVNTSDFSYTTIYYSGYDPSRADNTIFKIGNDVYAMQRTSSGWKVWKLDMTSLDSLTMVWNDVTNDFSGLDVLPASFSYVPYAGFDEDGSLSCRCVGIKKKDLN